MKSSRSSLWLDGCFDGFHYAHANAVRQSLYLFPGKERPRIVVGVHSDKEIVRNKGPPLFDETERYNLIRGCRWIDEVVEDVPYVTQVDIIQKHKIDYVVHGDDVVVDAQGNDCYGVFKQIGRYKECKRTDGISTTSLITRVLRPEEAASSLDDGRLVHLLDLFIDAIQNPFPKAYFKELASSAASCDAFRQWQPHRKPAYIGGSWDCFCTGHVELLRRAKEAAGGEDSFLVVGLWSDEVVMEYSRESPLLTLLERALALVQCKYTDGIIISAPKSLPPPIMRALGIPIAISVDDIKEASVEYVQVESPELQTVASLRTKLVTHLPAYEERQRRKGG